MYNNVTNAFKTKISEDSRTFKARFINTADSTDVIKDNILSANYTAQSLADTSAFSIGDTVSATLEVQILGSGLNVSGKEYEYQIGLVLGDDSVEYIPIGLFTAQKPTIADGLVSFTAYDRFVSKLGYLYDSSLTYPTDSKAMLREIQSESGISIIGIDNLGSVTVPQRDNITYDDEGNEVHTNTAPFAGFSYREAIGYIAMMHGCFATVNRSGAVELRRYVSTEFTVPISRSYSNLVKAETNYSTQYLTLHVGNGETTYTSGTSGTGVNVECPTGSQEIANYAFSMIRSLSFYPATVSFLGDPRIDLGDIITVASTNGNTVAVPIMSLVHTYDGGLTSAIGSYGGTSESETAQMTSPTATKADREYAEMLLLKELIADKVSTKKLEADYATIVSLDAVKADIEELKADQITVSYLTANFATIDSLAAAEAKISVLESNQITTSYLNANYATISNLTVTNGKIADLETTTLKTADLSAEVAKLGYATVEELNAKTASIGTLTADVGNIKTLMFGASTGTSITTDFANSVVSVIGNGQIADAMIMDLSVSKILAGDISTNKFRIVSDSGNMLMSDNTIQISDGSRARVQIGKDSNSDYNMYVWDATGNLMFDATGLTENGIQRSIIRNDMVSDTANIDAKKLDINSLFTQINGSSQTFLSSKVQLDTTGQTLDVAFESMTETVDGMEVGGRNLLRNAKTVSYENYSLVDLLGDESLEQLTDGEKNALVV